MRNVHLILVLAASLLPLATVQAAPADLPETGETSCSIISLPSGDIEICIDMPGVAWPNPRFLVGTGTTADCVTDKLTGLMWVRAPSALFNTWTNALTSANGLTLCGFSDWRLPNVNELESLVNSGAGGSVTFLNAQGFTGVQGVSYWSSSSYVASAALAWVVAMSEGAVIAVNKFDGCLVWPVRAGQ